MSNVFATLAAQTNVALDNAKKASAAEKKAATKKVAKPATKKASAQPKTAKPVNRLFKYQITEGRPGSGYNLFAFTQAWLEMTGMDKGKGADKADIATAAGFTAVNYHLSAGRMVMRNGKVYLTPGGKAHFAKRKESIEPEVVSAWKTLLTTGKANRDLHIAQNCIRAI